MEIKREWWRGQAAFLEHVFTFGQKVAFIYVQRSLSYFAGGATANSELHAQYDATLLWREECAGSNP